MSEKNIRKRLENRWSGLMHGLGAKPNIEMRDWLIMSWSEPHRHYHDFHHLYECLKFACAPEPNEIDLRSAQFALWFHDCVYYPGMDNNETLSLLHAQDFVRMEGLPAKVGADVSAAVKATFYGDRPPWRPAAMLAHDADLAILGQDKKRYAEYAEGVWREWRGVVSSREFCSARACILGRFLRRKRIYLTSWFQERFEAMAQMNLTDEIRELEKRKYGRPS